MIVLNMTDKRPIYEQIVDTYQKQISMGLIKPDEKIPSVRQLAIEMSINPNTIQKAYTELERNGYIYSVKGKGNFVSDISSLLPSRQAKYYRELDTILSKAGEYSLSKDMILNHISDYYDSDGGNSNDWNTWYK